MRTTATMVFAFVFALGVPGEGAQAQQSNMAHAHIGHVADAFGNTPEGQGLLPTALAEARIAADHAGYAAGNLEDLESMQRHAAHVLHAVDPSEIEAGPGLGYGVKRAAEGVIQHIEMAADWDGASDNVKTHAVHVATSARNVVERSDRIVELAKEIQDAESADAAAPLVTELRDISEQLIAGVDATGDGRIGWGEGEGGLEQAEQHMGLMKRGEGLD